MKNPFKEILEDEKLPDVMKNRVLKDINLINLSIDLADLFLVKNPDTIGTLFNEDKDNNNKTDKPSEE